MNARTAVERVIEHPAADAVTLQAVLEALADPVRRSIVRQLAHSDHDMACGTFGVKVAPSTSTHHFNVLRQAGIIRQHYEGTQKKNALRLAELEESFPGLLNGIIAAADREAREESAAGLRP